MGWPSYLEDIFRRREESGQPQIDETFHRLPKRRRDDHTDVRLDFEARKAAHTKRYYEQRRKTALKRFVIRILRRLHLIK